ncbi:hypothetical protein Dthio_PD1519 [Desulfonatronospira thiodismutans ASO3-1]|uniref:Uncharacterized protein n=1 Tax=Desulfonatronospira thiodismutans ASO3-1 TaxID=555779 RepID=D6SN45_9BACT|nr:hypothetical protein Dthio_PD1519 [Desulfonatronospira thiodismutans ASO3-1]
MHVFTGGISKVTLSNGNLRIKLTHRGAVQRERRCRNPDYSDFSNQ